MSIKKKMEWKRKVEEKKELRESEEEELPPSISIRKRAYPKLVQQYKYMSEILKLYQQGQIILDRIVTAMKRNEKEKEDTNIKEQEGPHPHTTEDISIENIIAGISQNKGLLLLYDYYVTVTEMEQVRELLVQKYNKTDDEMSKFYLLYAHALLNLHKEENVIQANKENQDNNVNNLQIAREILEQAKLTFLKQGPPGWEYLAEAYLLLGEVAMQDGKHEDALTDLQNSLDLVHKITPRDSYAIGKVHFKLGHVYSKTNNFDASIEQYKHTSILYKEWIVHLKSRLNFIEKKEIREENC